jgi:hypothetical protein
MKPGRNGRQRAVYPHWTMYIQWYRRGSPKFVPLLSCSPPELLYRRSPGGLPHVHLPPARLRLHSVVKSKADMSSGANGRFRCPQANDSCSHPPMSVKRDLLLMTPRDLRARFLKIHKHCRLAMEIADVGVSHDEIAQRRGGLPVHKLFSNVLMSRTEFRS